MSPLVVAIILTTVFGLFSLYYYNRDENKSRKLFREAIGRNVFFITFVAPLIAAFLFTLMISLVFRGATDTGKISRGDAIIFSCLFYLHGVYSAAMGIHALAKAFKDDVVRVRDAKMMRLIRFFHGPFSHTVSNISFNLILVLLAIYNVNHPLREALTWGETGSVIICGIILGAGSSVTYVVGNTMKLMRYVVTALVAVLIYLEMNSAGIMLRSPLSLVVVSLSVTTLVIMVVDSLHPTRLWFHKLVERHIVSVDSDWKRINGI